LIADQLGVDVKRVSDQTHLARDLGVDWLNRLELVIFVEDQTGLELDYDDVELIEVVGDLIRLFESAEAHLRTESRWQRRETVGRRSEDEFYEEMPERCLVSFTAIHSASQARRGDVGLG
jgi:acyl carrier protein